MYCSRTGDLTYSIVQCNDLWYNFPMYGSLGKRCSSKGLYGVSRALRIPIPAGVTHRLVRGYLMHFGYAHTLSVFDAAAGSTPDAAEAAGCRCGRPESLKLTIPK